MYAAADKDAGGITVQDREGKRRLFGFIGVTIALVRRDDIPDGNYSDYTALAAKIKKALKNKGGSRWGGVEII